MISAKIDSNSALSFRNVTIQYDKHSVSALDNCTFEIHQNERVALLGLNGAGKTSILLASVGLLNFSGAIHVLGTPLSRASARAIREKVGLLFANPQDQLLFPQVLEDVAYSFLSHGISQVESRRQARLALSLLGAEHLAERSTSALSRGEKLRVALAGTMALKPSLLLMDEPTSGLDPSGVRRLSQQLRGLPSTILIASHDLGFVARCCDRWLLVEKGRIVDEGCDFHAVHL